MTTHDLKAKAAHLEQMFENTQPEDRLKLRPDVQRVIQTLAAHHLPIPLRLRQIERKLDEEAYDAMFENMPV
ncbi:MAG: hypothetical protein HKP51_10340 [Sulfitobacter sp.]|nr:hypothetical protein [Sulfitobacter sp.]